MHSIISKLDKQFNRIEYFLLLTSGATVLFIMFLVTFDVIMRNIFSKPLVGVFEIVSLLLIGVISFGFSYVQGKKEHILVEIATNKLPKTYKNILDLIGYIIGLFVIAILTWHSIGFVQSAFITKEYTMGLLRLPLWPSKLLLCIGLITLTIRLVIDVFYLVTNIKAVDNESEN